MSRRGSAARTARRISSNDVSCTGVLSKPLTSHCRGLGGEDGAALRARDRQRLKELQQEVALHYITSHHIALHLAHGAEAEGRRRRVSLLCVVKRCRRSPSTQRGLSKRRTRRRSSSFQTPQTAGGSGEMRAERSGGARAEAARARRADGGRSVAPSSDVVTTSRL